MGDLTANFSASEFSVGGVPWPAGYDANQQALAGLAQWIEDGVGPPGIITSAFRTAAHNADVGGSSTSQHMSGEALDLVYRASSIYAISAYIFAGLADGSAPAFGQFIAYPADGHIHMSLPTANLNQEMLYEQDAADGSQTYISFSDPSQLPGFADVPALVPELSAAISAATPTTWAWIVGGLITVWAIFSPRRRRSA